MRTLTIVLLLTLAVRSYAKDQLPLLEDGNIAQGPTKVLEGLLWDAERGKGKVQFKSGAKVESVDLASTEDNFYTLALAFHSSSLPRSFEEEFKGKHIIQLTIGRFGDKASEKSSNIATISMIMNKLPSGRLSLKAVLPETVEDKGVEPSALITFVPPSTAKQRTDEEKLKDTFFSQNGTVTLFPLNKPQAVEVKYQSTKLPFKTQKFRLEFNAIVSTPFNTEKGDLTGSVEFPVYWPNGKLSELFVKRIASQSLSGLMSPIATKNNIPENRDLAGSTSQKKNR